MQDSDRKKGFRHYQLRAEKELNNGGAKFSFSLENHLKYTKRRILEKGVNTVPTSYIPITAIAAIYMVTIYLAIVCGCLKCPPPLLFCSALEQSANRSPLENAMHLSFLLNV